MKAEQLRKSILQMAIQGKLVPQDSNDEPASVLLEKIRAEKQRLIKEGKIKKDKVDSVIFRGEDNRHYEKVGNNTPVCIEGELPFEIPESWCWVRHNDIFEVSGGSQPPKSKFTTSPQEGYTRLYQIRDYGPNPQPIYIPNNTASKITQKGDILLARYGASLGKVFWAENGAYNVAMAKVIPYFDMRLICKEYLYFYYKSSIYQETILGNARSAQAGFNKEDLSKMFFPLPPFAEQQRIVASIKNFEPLITEYDKLEQQKSKIDGEIYERLKKSILQYAIQGKLVPQDENDEPASELLKRIRAEKKAQLGKKYVDSYIYKGDDNCYYEKVGNNEPVLLENLPFDIPDSWAWCRLEQAVKINPRNNIDDDLNVSFIEMKSLQDGFNNCFIYETRKWATVKSGFTHFQDNDVAFAKITPCFQNRKSVVFINLQNGYGAGTTELHILRAYAGTIIPDYLLWYVKSPYFIEWGKQHFSGTAGQQRFGTEEVKKTLIPIPPLEEQKQIVNKIHQILNSIEKDEV